MDPDDNINPGVVENNAILVTQSLSDIYTAAAILAEQEVR